MVTKILHINISEMQQKHNLEGIYNHELMFQERIKDKNLWCSSQEVMFKNLRMYKEGKKIRALIFEIQNIHKIEKINKGKHLLIYMANKNL